MMKIRKAVIFVITVFISCFFAWNNLCFGLADNFFMERARSVSRLDRSIDESVNVILNNVISHDKKFICMEITIKWKIEKLSQPFKLFDTQRKMVEFINDYLSDKVHFAAMLVLIKIESLDIDSQINKIQIDILEKVKEGFNLSAIDRKDIKIENIEIKRYVILDNKYEGEDFPGATIRVEKGKTAKTYVKEKFGSPDRIKKTDEKEIWYYDDFEVIVDKSRGVEKFTYIVEYDGDGIVSRDYLYKE